MKRGTDGYYHLLYKTTNLINGRFYIGIHSTRILEDGYLGSGKRISNEIKKYGKENFKREILEYCIDRITLASKEKEIVTEDLRRQELCLNLANGGEAWDGVNSNKNENYYQIRKENGRTSSRKNWNNLEYIENFKRISSERSKLQHLEKKLFVPTFAGNNHSKEAKNEIGRKNAITQLGKQNSQFGKCWVYHELIGSKTIKKELLPEYLEQGWIKGRKMIL